jgi:RNA-directed DNA polymerase
MTGTPRPEPVFTKQQRIAELARDAPDMSFTNLAHHIDIEWMFTAHARTRKDGAVGVDGQTAEDYEVNLEANLQNLLDRAKSGTYVAPPVRRVHIPKAGSPNETRPLGIPICRSYCTSLQRRWGLIEGSLAQHRALFLWRNRLPRPSATGWLT